MPVTVWNPQAHGAGPKVGRFYRLGNPFDVSRRCDRFEIEKLRDRQSTFAFSVAGQENVLEAVGGFVEDGGEAGGLAGIDGDWLVCDTV